MLIMTDSFKTELVYIKACCYTTETQHDQLTDALERSRCLSWIRRSAIDLPINGGQYSYMTSGIKFLTFKVLILDSQLDQLC